MTAAAKRGGKRVGYVRVSTVDQNADRQLEGVALDKKLTDKASGKDIKRPQLQAALDMETCVAYSQEGGARQVPHP